MRTPRGSSMVTSKLEACSSPIWSGTNTGCTLFSLAFFSYRKSSNGERAPEYLPPYYKFSGSCHSHAIAVHDNPVLLSFKFYLLPSLIFFKARTIRHDTGGLHYGADTIVICGLADAILAANVRYASPASCKERILMICTWWNLIFSLP